MRHIPLTKIHTRLLSVGSSSPATAAGQQMNSSCSDRADQRAAGLGGDAPRKAHTPVAPLYDRGRSCFIFSFWLGFKFRGKSTLNCIETRETRQKCVTALCATWPPWAFQKPCRPVSNCASFPRAWTIRPCERLDEGHLEAQIAVLSWSLADRHTFAAENLYCVWSHHLSGSHDTSRTMQSARGPRLITNIRCQQSGLVVRKRRPEGGIAAG